MEDDLDFSTRGIIKEAFLEVCFNKADKLEELIPKLYGNLCISFFTSTECQCGSELEMIVRYHSNFQQQNVEQMADIIEKGICDHASKQGSDIHLVTIPLLHFACYFSHMEITKLLIEHGASVCSETSPSRHFPLQMAISSKNSEHLIVDIMTLLLDNGTNPSQCDAKTGQSILHMAVNFGYVTAVALLLKYNCDINAEDNDGKTALYVAVTSRNLDIVNILVTSNADVNKGSKNDPVILKAAVMTGKYGIVKAFLSTPLDNMNINESGPYTRFRLGSATALETAVQHGRTDIVTLLLTHKADVNYVVVDGNTPIILSVSCGHTDILQELIKFGADLNHRNNYGCAAIHKAALEGRSGFVDILLQRGCLKDIRTDDGKTPLALACQGVHESIALNLMNFNVNVNNTDKYLDTPLHYSSSEGSVQTCKRLVELGADPNARDSIDMTPLWCAVYESSRAVVKLLIQINVSLSVASLGYKDLQLFDSFPYLPKPSYHKEPQTPLYVAFDQCKDPFIAAMIIIAGVKLSEEKWLRSKDLDVFSNSPGSAPHVNLLRSYIESPVSLKRLCRDEIRRRLSTRLADALPLFGLPASLTDYLLIKHDLELCESGTLDLLHYKFD